MENKAYTYLIGWSKLDKWYYGVRWKNGCRVDELWKDYFTSSSYVKAFRTEHGDPDVIQIRKEFTDIDKARRWEQKVLKRMNVIVEDRWLNRTDNISIRNAQPHPPEKMAIIAKKISESRKGQRHSNESICKGAAKRVGLVWWYLGNSEIKSRECPGEGWVRGRCPSIKELLRNGPRFCVGNTVNSGRIQSSTANKKRSETLKGRKFTEETKLRMSASGKGKKKGYSWWTDGSKSTLALECPPGFYRGRIKPPSLVQP